MRIIFKNSCLCFLIIGSYSFTCLHNTIRTNNVFIQKNNKNKELIGLWVTENKDLKVEVFEMDGLLFGKLVEFTCTHKVKKAMQEHKDEKNPNPTLRNRSWLNAIILYGLKYNSDNKWEGGLIYDLSSGKTYSASVTLNNNTINVRGYWVFELFGKSLIFKKAVI